MALYGMKLEELKYVTGESKIYPTKKCFDDAIDNMMKIVKQLDRSELRKLRLVHAVVLDNNDKPIAHAWIEYNKYVIFNGWQNGELATFAITRKEYYKYVKIKDYISYGVYGVIQESCKYQTNGPWVDRFIELLAQGE